MRLRAQGKHRKDTKIRFRCDCREMAAVVVLVQVGTEDGVSEIRLPLCEECLEEEKETQAWLDLLGVSHEWMTVRGRKARGTNEKRKDRGKRETAGA